MCVPPMWYTHDISVAASAHYHKDLNAMWQASNCVEEYRRSTIDVSNNIRRVISLSLCRFLMLSRGQNNTSNKHYFFTQCATFGGFFFNCHILMIFRTL